MIASSLPRLPTMGIRVNHPLTLRPRILLEVLLPWISLVKNTLPLTWRTTSLLLIIVHLRHLFFLRVMSPLGTPHSRKT